MKIVNYYYYYYLLLGISSIFLRPSDVINSPQYLDSKFPEILEFSFQYHQQFTHTRRLAWPRWRECTLHFINIRFSPFFSKKKVNKCGDTRDDDIASLASNMSCLRGGAGTCPLIVASVGSQKQVARESPSVYSAKLTFFFDSYFSLKLPSNEASLSLCVHVRNPSSYFKTFLCQP